MHSNCVLCLHQFVHGRDVVFVSKCLFQNSIEKKKPFEQRFEWCSEYRGYIETTC